MLFPDTLRRGFLVRLFGGAMTLSLFGGAALEAAVPVAPYFNGVFPSQAPADSGWTTENAFPNLTFVDPIWVGDIPGTNELMVIEKAGVVRRFPNHPAATTAQMQVVLDLSASVQVSEDQGLYRVAFHPEFGQPGSTHANEVFVTYNFRPATADAAPDKSMWRLSRFQWQPASGTINPASEYVLIQQYDPHRWHNGGAMVFDSAGYLLVSCGDGGGANDEYALTQKLNGGFFGGILRIDVDNKPARSHAIRRQPLSHASKPASFPASFTQGYGIPNDNPWLSTGGTVLEEFHAIGLRSPHSMSLDPATGELWVGDVGQAAREELNLIKRGGNYQWPFMEGSIAGPKSKNSFSVQGTETLPVYSYDRTNGGCVLSAGRYRGAKWSAHLEGRLLFADNIAGSLHEMTLDPEGGAPDVRKMIPDLGTGIYSGVSGVFADAAGEIYLLKLNGQGNAGGTIRKLVQSDAMPQPPALLSATGLFSDTAALVPSAALVPYDVASPLWSDGASKRRWLAVPTWGSRGTLPERILYSATGNWTFPPGSVFVKHFEMAVDERNPSVVKRLETRVMVCTTHGGKYGLTYRWNEQGTDAVLLPDGAEEMFTVTMQDGSTASRTWSYPSRADCLQCHSDVTGQALGLRTHQVNLTVPRPGTGELVNQLKYFNSESLLTTKNEGYYYPASLTTTELDAALEARRVDDETAPLEHRVRSYLDSNCAHCHQPDGPVPYFDARLQTPLRNQGLVNEAIRGQFHLPGGCYLKAGDPALSAVLIRTASTEAGVRMPPLAKHAVDDVAVAAMTEYLEGLTSSEFDYDPLPQARYVRFMGTQAIGGLLSVAELDVLDGTGSRIPGVTVEAFTSEATPGNANRVIDGDPSTAWSTDPSGTMPKSITLDLEAVRGIGGLRYLPRQDSSDGRPTMYSAQYSLDGITWTLMATNDQFSGSVSQGYTYKGFIGRRKIRCSLGAAAVTPARDFPVTIVFDSKVTGFYAGHLVVTGGTITSFRGNGYYYVAMIRASQPQVTVTLPANQVNPGPYGNRASQMLTIESGMDTPPVPTFAATKAYYSSLPIRLSFDKPCSGLTVEDFTVTGGTLEWLIPDGDAWNLILVPNPNSNLIQIQIREGAVMGANGLQMESAASISRSRVTPILESEAEVFTRYGFKSVMDPGASNGSYVWVEESVRGAVTTADSSLRLSRTVYVPYAGNYRLRGWTRADDLASNSLHVGLGPSGSGASILPWITNQGPGEIGSGLFHAGFARDAGADHVFALPDGSSTLEIFAAEDGTRLDRVMLIPERPFALWSGTFVSSQPTRTATIRFTSPVTGLTLDDFETMEGQVTSISGGGATYTVTLKPDAYKMAVRLKENAVIDEFGATSTRSDWHSYRWVDTYDYWASERGIYPYNYYDTLDTDKDGLGQLTEYALGLEPKVSDLRQINPADPASRGLPWVGVTGTGSDKRLTMIFHRRRSSAPATYAVEFTGNLSQFDRQSDFTGRTEILDAQWERVTVQDTTATGTEPARFGRLVITRSP